MEDYAFSEGAVLRTVRRLLLAILTLGMIGTAADLMLLDHYEDAWQLAPLVLIAIALVLSGLIAVNGARIAVVAMQCMMVLFIAAGLTGMLLHYLGNQEFQREIDPQAGGWGLVLKVITAKAPPALAPAVMIQMGLLGLLYTYKHPALTDRAHWTESK
jgi:hypothetical protein